MQYHFPNDAQFGRNVPKNKIYTHARVSHGVRQKFVQQVDRLIWQYKLAPETINLPAAGAVREIQVFDIHLKAGVADVDEAVLRAIDRAIAHPIHFRIFAVDRVRSAMAYKRPHESDSQKWVVDAYFHSPWLMLDDAAKCPATLPVALNLAALYESLLGDLLPEPARKGESLPDQIRRLAQLDALQQQTARLENAIQKEKQFNRKVELNGQLRQLQQQIRILRGTHSG